MKSKISIDQNYHPSIDLYSAFQPELHPQRKNPRRAPHEVTQRPIVNSSSLAAVKLDTSPFVLNVDVEHRELYFVNRRGATMTCITT